VVSKFFLIFFLAILNHSTPLKSFYYFSILLCPLLSHVRKTILKYYFAPLPIYLSIFPIKDFVSDHLLFARRCFKLRKLCQFTGSTLAQSTYNPQNLQHPAQPQTTTHPSFHPSIHPSIQPFGFLLAWQS